MKKNEIKSPIQQHHHSTTSSIIALELDTPLGLSWQNLKIKLNGLPKLEPVSHLA